MLRSRGRSQGNDHGAAVDSPRKDGAGVNLRPALPPPPTLGKFHHMISANFTYDLGVYLMLMRADARARGFRRSANCFVNPGDFFVNPGELFC